MAMFVASINSVLQEERNGEYSNYVEQIIESSFVLSTGVKLPVDCVSDRVAT